MVKFLPKILKWAEIISACITLLGIAFKLMSYPGSDSMLMIGMVGLASTYFYWPYTVIEPLDQKNDKKDTGDTFAIVLRKLLYIGTSVYWVAFLFALLHLKGANEMIIIGVGTLIIAGAVSMVLILGKHNRMIWLRHPLIRATLSLLLYFSLPLFR